MSTTPSAHLHWRDIKYTLNAGKKKEKLVLDGVSGSLAPSSLLAIMGPSGSGKTSLLNVVACRVPKSRGATLHGSILVNGHNMASHMGTISAYVEQDEALFSLSTVRETLVFTARLRMPRMAREEMLKRVQSVISELNLVNAADSVVGSIGLRGISGGERKRVNIGIELLNDPPLLFMDEPTSGLDSFQAQAVMETLRALANAGRTVIASIHQPRSSIYGMLDQICLLSGGRTAYFGPAGARLSEHFEHVGHRIPPAYNPADFLLDVASIDYRDTAASNASSERVQKLLRAWDDQERKALRESHSEIAAQPSSKGAALATLQRKDNAHPPSFCMRLCDSTLALRLLFRRTLIQLTRDKAALTFKYAGGCFFAALFGLVYFQMDRSQTSIQNRTGILFFLAMNQAFASSIDTATIIPVQLAVVNRERAARMYSIAPFYLATLSCTIPLEFLPQMMLAAIQYFLTALRPGAGYFFKFLAILVLESQCAIGLGMILSASIKGVEAAPKVAPIAVILFLAFSGYFLNDESIPDWLIWLKYLSFIRYAFKAFVINEFRGAEFTCLLSDGRNATICASGDNVLESLAFDEDEVWTQCVAMGSIAIGFNLIAYLILVLRKPAFLRLANVEAGFPTVSAHSVPSEP